MGIEDVIPRVHRVPPIDCGYKSGRSRKFVHMGPHSKVWEYAGRSWWWKCPYHHHFFFPFRNAARWTCVALIRDRSNVTKAPAYLTDHKGRTQRQEQTLRCGWSAPGNRRVTCRARAGALTRVAKTASKVQSGQMGLIKERPMFFDSTTAHVRKGDTEL